MDLRHQGTHLVAPHGDFVPGKWVDGVNRIFPTLEVIPTRGAGFWADIRSAATRDLQVTDIAATGHRVERSPDFVSEADIDLCKVSIQVEGTGVLQQNGRELRIEPGSIAFYDTVRPYSLEFDGPFRFIVAMFPASAIQLPKGLPGECAARPIPADTPLSQATAAYLMSLAENLRALAGPGAAQLERTGIDLLTTLVEEQFRDDESDIERSTLVHEICADLNARLGDPGLALPRIAERHGISVRHLQSIFSAYGEPPAEWIRRRRLQEARRDLVDPLQLSTPIAEIGAKWGFDDPGYFGRAFRKMYGCSPREWRAGAAPRLAS